MTTEPGPTTVAVRDFAAPSPPTPLSSSSTPATQEALSDKPPRKLSFGPARDQDFRPADDPESPRTPVSLGSTLKQKGKGPKLKDSAAYTWPKSYKKRYTLNATPTDFERRYPRDRPGTEIEDGARVWRLYRDRASEQDNDLFEAWKEVLDVLLVFAGLFSAVCTAFIIESNKLLQPDWAEISARSDYASWAANNDGNTTMKAPQHPDTYVPPLFAQWANWLWFTSLSLSLIVALLAILAKQWIGQYRLRMRAQVPSHRLWVWRHRALADGLLKYKLEAVIATLPPMLHLSLFVFFAGLYTFLQPFSPQLALVIGIGLLVLLGVYCILSLLLPLWYGDCPMSTPLIEWFQYWFASGYRAAMLWMEGKWPRIGDWTRIEEPAPDMTAFHEERLFRSSTIHKRNTRALCWMVNHFRDFNEVSVALEAVGALSAPECRGHFKPDEYQVLRDMTLWRAHTIEAQAGPEESDAERVGMLRTSLFLTIIGVDADKNMLRDTQAVSKYEVIQTHDAPFLYQALVQHEQSMRDTLDELERWFLWDSQRDFPATSVSLALWVASAADCLLFETEMRGRVIGRPLHLSQLAMLLLCIVHISHAADVLDHDQSGSRESESPEQRETRAYTRTKHEARYARQIAEHVVLLLPDVHRTDLPRTDTAKSWRSEDQDPSEDPWIVESLLIWGRILKDPKILGEQPRTVNLQTLYMVYNRLLAHISTRTLPIDRSSNLKRILDAFSFLTTPQFAAVNWSTAALLGPFDLLRRVGEHLSGGNGDQDAWQQLSTLLAHLFAYYVARHDNLIGRDSLAQRTSQIIDIMGRNPPRSPFSLRTSLIARSLSNGQRALLKMPTTQGMASIWQSACRLRVVDPNSYNAKMFAVATTIAFNLSAEVGRSQEQRSQAEPWLYLLLWPDGATMLREENGRMLDVHVKKISPKVHEEAHQRLDSLSDPKGQESMTETEGELGVAPASPGGGEIDRRAKPQTVRPSSTAYSGSFFGSGGQDSDLEAGRSGT